MLYDGLGRAGSILNYIVSLYDNEIIIKSTLRHTNRQNRQNPKIITATCRTAIATLLAVKNEDSQQCAKSKIGKNVLFKTPNSSFFEV